MEQRIRDLYTAALKKFNLDTPDQAVNFARNAISGGKDGWQKPAPDIASVRGLNIPGKGGSIPARLYVPLGAGVAPGPGLVFFHGGGFIVGDVASYDNACRRLAACSRLRVLSVEYRLAPEHPFPAAHDDAQSALQWVLAHPEKVDMDPARLTVGGDSAGGTLSAWLAQWARDQGIKLAGQFLIFPLLQLVETRSKLRKSPDGHIFGNQALTAIRNLYAGDADLMDPRLSPLFCNDLHGLAPTLMVTAGLDPLKAEGRAYADKLAAFGVPVRSLHYNALTHGFISLTSLLPGALTASEECFETFGEIMGSR